MLGNNYKLEWLIEENELFKQHVFFTRLSNLEHVSKSLIVF